MARRTRTGPIRTCWQAWGSHSCSLGDGKHTYEQSESQTKMKRRIQEFVVGVKVNIKPFFRTWRDGSKVKSTGCSYRKDPDSVSSTYMTAQNSV